VGDIVYPAMQLPLLVVALEVSQTQVHDGLYVIWLGNKTGSLVGVGTQHTESRRRTGGGWVAAAQCDGVRSVSVGLKGVD
jgi:hypothetical protein